MPRFARASLTRGALAALALLPAAAGAQPSGFSAAASLGGGGAIAGSRADAASGGIFAAELGAGYELSPRFRPELSLLVGLSPSTLLGLRPGLAYRLEGMPLHVTGALDFAAPRGSWRLRWLLGGGGGEIRFTDQLGVFAEARAGIPLASNAGLLLELRAGARFRL